MVNVEEIYKKLIAHLNNNKVKFKLFEHRAALTYQDLAEVQKETGFFGSEAKCMVLRADDKFIVYITLQGNKLNLENIKVKLALKKLRLVNEEVLKENFGAEPGCAYPFGFGKEVDIFVDPQIFKQEWLLFSPVYPTKTIQAKSIDLKRVFDSLENKVEFVSGFNQS